MDAPEFSVTNKVQPLQDDDSVGELTERRPLWGAGAHRRSLGYARDDKLRVVTFIKGRQIGWTEKKQQVPPLRFAPVGMGNLVWLSHSASLLSVQSWVRL